MSRIGKLPIALPSGVTAAINGSVITVAGSKGSLEYTLLAGVTVVQEGAALVVSVDDENNSQKKAFWGLTRALIANMVVGVSEGYKKALEVQGVGYKFEVTSPTKLTMALGFSHKVVLDAPKGVTISADANEKNIIHISGIDKQLVGYFSALVRSKKKPEPYKGKGIRYVGEHVRRKAGKTGGKK